MHVFHYRLDKSLTALAMLTLLVIALLSFLNWWHIQDAVGSTAQSRNVLEACGGLFNGIKDAESAVRTFVLTGREQDLKPYTELIESLPVRRERLLAVATPSQSALMERIDRLTNERLSLLARGISIRQEQGLKAAGEFVRDGGGIEKMGELSAAYGKIFTEEYDRQTLNSNLAERRAFEEFLLGSLGCLATLVVLWFMQRAVDRGIERHETARRELANAHQRLEITLASIGDGVIATDARGLITLLNPVAERLTGWSRDEALHQPAEGVFRIADETTGTPLPSPLERARKTGSSEKIPPHTVLLPKQGEPVAIADSISAIRSADGENEGAVLVFRDIRESRLAQRQIEKWHRLFRASGFGMAIIDSEDDTLRNINPAFADMHGYREEELVGQSFSMLLAEPNETGGRWKEDGRVTFEARHRHRNGQLFPVLTDMTMFRDDAGRATERVAYFSDISTRILAERVNQETQERFKLAVEVVGDIIWTTNAEGHLNSEQRAWSEYTGQTFKEYRGLGWMRAVHPDDLDYVKQSWMGAVARGSKFISENRLRRHDGVYRLFSVRALPLLDEHGQVREWVGVNADITDERASQHQLSESEGRFRALATALPQVIWSTRSDGQFEYANPSWDAYLGPPANDGWESLLHPEDAETVLPKWREARKQGQAFDFQARLKRASDGSYRNFLCRKVPWLNSAGQVVRWFGSCTDIDDQSRRSKELIATNAALLRSNTDLEQFAYAASHDMQEPLRMVAIYTQLLREEYGDRLDDTARSFIDQSLKASRRMETLLQALLAYSLVTAPAADESEADANAVAQDAIGNLESLIARTSASVTIGDLPRVRLPSVRLTQVLQNLVGNSIKYRRDGVPPRIEISATPHGGCRWLFSVQDNGMGIAPQYLNQIFGIFKRLHGLNYEGTGIGLAICQRIIEHTDGKIWAESDEGLGTTMKFTLPGV